MQSLIKRIIALFVVVCLSICFAGCGGTSSNGDKTGSSGGTQNMNADEEAFFDNVPAELIGTTVKFATWIDHTKTEAAPVMADFTELTGIKVELDTIPQGEYITKLSARIAAGQSPDIVVENGDWPRLM